MILFESGFALNTRIGEARKRQGYVATITARSIQIDFVAADVEVAILPEMIAEQISHRGVAASAIDDPQVERYVGLIWRRGGYLQRRRGWKTIVCESQVAQGSRRQFLQTKAVGVP